MIRAELDERLISSAGSLLAHEELYREDRVRDDQEDQCQIDRDIAGRHKIEELASHVLQVALVVDICLVELFVEAHIGLCQLGLRILLAVQKSVQIDL